MNGYGDKLASFDDATVFDAGERVAFTVKTATGKSLRVNCELAELGDVFSYLGQLAKAAGEMRDLPPPIIPEAYNYLAPIPVQGIGFQAGNHAGETLLVARLFGFDMAFSVESSELKRLGDELVRILHTLSPGGEQLH